MLQAYQNALNKNEKLVSP